MLAHLDDAAPLRVPHSVRKCISSRLSTTHVSGPLRSYIPADVKADGWVLARSYSCMMCPRDDCGKGAQCAPPKKKKVLTNHNLRPSTDRSADDPDLNPQIRSTFFP